MPTTRLGDDAIEHIARIIGDAVTGSVVDQLLAAAGIPASDESTKWRRIATSLHAAQYRAGNGDCVIKLVKLAVRPQRWANDRPKFESLCDALNGVLVTGCASSTMAPSNGFEQPPPTTRPRPSASACQRDAAAWWASRSIPLLHGQS